MPRFRHAPGDDDGGAGIDMSPLMDCVFILLIFFIVTTTFVDESGIDVDKPQPGGSSNSGESKTVVIRVSEGGKVFHENQPIGFSGVRPLVKRAVDNDDETPVIIRSEATTPAGLLVRVLDEVKLGGAEKVSIATERKR